MLREGLEDGLQATARNRSGRLIPGRPRQARPSHGQIELDEEIGDLGQYLPGSSTVKVNRANIKIHAEVNDLSWRSELYKTVYHEAFHRAVYPFSQWVSRMLGVKDVYAHSRKWELAEEFLAERYGQVRGLIRSVTGR